MNEAQSENGPYNKQHKDLQQVFYELRDISKKKIEKLKSLKTAPDEAKINKYKTTLNTKVETLHLAVSNYFGDCDRRKLRIETMISEQVDVEGFSNIAATLRNL